MLLSWVYDVGDWDVNVYALGEGFGTFVILVRGRQFSVEILRRSCAGCLRSFGFAASKVDRDLTGFGSSLWIGSRGDFKAFDGDMFRFSCLGRL